MVNKSEKGKTPNKGMEEAAPQGEMPTGGMNMETPQSKMPTGKMQEAAPQNQMPSGKMREAAPHGKIPISGKMEKGEPGMPVFRPRTLPPGTLPPPLWEQGVIEIEFKDGIGQEVIAAAAGAPQEIRSPAGVDLTELNRILRQYQLQKAEPTLLIKPEDAAQAQAAAQQKSIEVSNLGNFVTLHFLPTSDIQSIAQELSQLPEIKRAVPVPKAIPPQTPMNEPLIGASDQVVVNPVTGLENQWYIFRCRANNAWSMSSGDGVVIADIDWGYRTSHQDLASRLDLNHAYNSYDGGINVSHGNSISHGTAVMGITGAADNDLGVGGFAYGSTLWPIQANSGPGTPLGGNAWARAIEWVRTADSGGRRKVIILEVQTGSYGNYEMVPSVNAAIRTAIASGVVVCVAAGNGDRDAGIDDSGNTIPDTGSILVGATAYHPTENQRAWFSNYGSRIVVSAPGDGEHDLTCNSSADDAYRNGFGGTSGATPKVAGTVALMLSVNPSLTHEEIRTILNNTGTPVITDTSKPVGTFLNSEAAVREARRGTTGRLEVFARGTDHALWHIWQVAPNDGWSGWESLGGWIDLPVVGRNADGRLEVFVVGSDHALWHKWQVAPNDGWSDWASLGGTIDMLAVGQNADGRLEVFARGMDGALWHIWQTAPNDGWSDWASRGGTIDMLVVGQNADGRLEVFARGMDGALWHIWQSAPNDGWSDWTSMGGTIDMLAVGQNADGRLEVFARGMDRALWHIWQVASNDGWSGWESLGGWIDLPVVGKNADGRLEVFVIGSDHALWHKWQVAPNDGWSDWASRGGWIDMLAVGQNADGRLETFARGMDGALWHIWQVAPNDGWSDWASCGGIIDMLALGQNIRG